MTLPEWTKPGIYGAIVGAIAISIAGFTWLGWTTSRSADDMARDHASAAVTQAMVPVCLNLSLADPERDAKLALINEASGFTRRNALMDTGWATIPGTDTPNRQLSIACLAELDLSGS